mmetsp:Transcript_144272/g.359643  ORF Transcript_144272/g.359643 Transcript_144272/m.359643 type:complete len:106 (-) Transcript_144272:124-441(-)
MSTVTAIAVQVESTAVVMMIVLLELGEAKKAAEICMVVMQFGKAGVVPKKAAETLIPLLKKKVSHTGMLRTPQRWKQMAPIQKVSWFQASSEMLATMAAVMSGRG